MGICLFQEMIQLPAILLGRRLERG